MSENKSQLSDRCTEGTGWRWNLHHDEFPNTCHSDAAVTELFWKPFFPASFPYDSYFSYEQQVSFPFTLNCPRQPPVEMHWATTGWEWQGAHSNVTNVPDFPKKSHSSGNGNAPDIYTVNLTAHSAIYCYIFLIPILIGIGSSQGTGVPLPSHPKVSVFLGWNASSYADDHSSRCWNTRMASFRALILVFSTHEQTSKQILKAMLTSDICLWTVKTGTFLTTNPSLNCNKLSNECRIDTSFLHSDPPALQQLPWHCWNQQKHWGAIPSHWARHAKTLQRKCLFNNLNNSNKPEKTGLAGQELPQYPQHLKTILP